ncbi:MAG: magnesium transporter [Parvibaculaceae bacterium]
MADITTERQIRDEWGSLAPDFVAAVQAALGAGDNEALRGEARGVHAADMADLIEALEPDERVALIAGLGRSFDGEALAELDEGVRDQLMAALPADVVASAIQKLDTDDAAYLIEDLSKESQEEILAKVPREDRLALNRALEYPEGTAGRLMQTEFVAVPDFWTIGKTIDHMRTEPELPEDFVEIYVVNPSFHLTGVVPVSRVLRNKRDRRIADIMEKEQTVFAVTDKEDEIAFKFKQYNLVSAAVVDADQRLVGVLMVDDVVDVIEDEAEEDMRYLGGVTGEETINDSVWRTTKSRFSWRLLNLVTALLASWVISWFDATINQMVALAVLMPIVASMGGNAGTQTMTVAVRALAMRDLGPFNAFRVTLRECASGLLSGLIFALLVGGMAFWWFGSDRLGLIIGAAMIINLFAAALAGILVPLALDYYDVDPAIASGVFVTTVTDVVGFFAFLGLAALWLV